MSAPGFSSSFWGKKKILQESKKFENSSCLSSKLYSVFFSLFLSFYVTKTLGSRRYQAGDRHMATNTLLPSFSALSFHQILSISFLSIQTTDCHLQNQNQWQEETRIRCSLVSCDACLKSLPSSYCSSFNQGFDKQNVIPLFQWWYYSSAYSCWRSDTLCNHTPAVQSLFQKESGGIKTGML